MAESQLWLYGRITLGANGRGTITLQAGEGDAFVLRNMTFRSTGAFVVLRLRTSGGREYISDQVGTGIPNTFFTPTNFDIAEVERLEPPIVINPSEILYLDLQDTSGASNTISVLFTGVRQF